MTILNVRHTTVYRYGRPVRLGDHRLMLRPRDSHDLRLIQTSLKFSPAASVRWIHDVFGNSVAIASFAQPASELRIESLLQLETYAVERPAGAVTPDAVSYPFIYSADDRIDLGRLTEPHHPDPHDRLGAWARGFVRGNPTDTSALLADLNSGVGKWISYQSRDAEGTQTPIETLNRGWGSCRDLAVLLIEAARRLGFGARVVTGYLYDPPAKGAPAPRSGPAAPMRGPISMCRAPAGSPTIRPTVPSTAPISSGSPSPATSAKRSPSPAASSARRRPISA